MPRNCGPCDHDRRADLDFELLLGVSATAVARRFNLGAHAVRRHANGHLAELDRSEAWERFADALVARLKAREDALSELLISAASSQNVPAAAAALRDLVVMSRAVARVRRRSRAA